MASKDQDITKMDLYDLLGINLDAGLQEIKTAYRKKALTCHPDKNPDNPDAVKLFHQLSKALEILTDKAARDAYDKILKARKAAEIRNKLLDSKRKKLKDDLESREKEAESKKFTRVDAETQLQKEIERLRKEGSRLVEEEVAYLREQIKKAERLSADMENPRLKIQWKKTNDGSPDPYTEQTLKEIFQKYGEVLHLVKSTKRRAIIEFLDINAAESAYRCEVGYPAAPLEISWLMRPPTVHQTPRQNVNDTTPIFGTSSIHAEKDYESVVLTKLRQAQERKRLIEQMQKEDAGAV